MRTLLVAALVATGIPTSAPAAQPTPEAIVHIRDDAFIPATIAVRTGTRVTFVNDDDDAHTATADDGSWDSEGLNQAQRWSHAFTKAGKVTYHCTVHPMMHGTIVVRTAAR